MSSQKQYFKLEANMDKNVLKPPSNEFLFRQLAVLGTVFLVLFQFGVCFNIMSNFGEKDQPKSGSALRAESLPSLQERPTGQRCIGLGNKGGMDQMLSKYDLIYLVFPAKAGGTTVKTFTQKCLGMNVEDNVLNKSVDLRKFFKTVSKIPPFISSHLYFSGSLSWISRMSVRSSLTIYIHREETSRLKSAIREVAVRRSFKEQNMFTEDALLDVVENQLYEIGFGGTRLLNCDVYKDIKENSPNLVFLHYTQIDKLLKLLAKHHCPNNTPQKLNSGDTKSVKMVKTDNHGIMELNEWLEAKSNLLEHAFNLKNEGSCMGETKKMEHNLLLCPDEALQYSGTDLFPSLQ